MRKRALFIMILLIAFSNALTAQNNADTEGDKTAIRDVIEQFYFEVVYDDKDLSELAKGFHEEFNMYVLYDNKIDKRSLLKWTERLENVRARNAQAQRPQYSFEPKLIDVTGPTGIAKIEIYADGKLKYTDYLSLYRFKEGWKIMTKLFTQH